MKIRVEIDSESLLRTREGREIAEVLIGEVTDDRLIEEILNRNLVSDVLDSMNVKELEDILHDYEIGLLPLKFLTR